MKTTELCKQTEYLKSEGYFDICFLLPGCYMAGGSKLFCMMADYLSQNTDLQIHFIDYPDGISHELLADNEKIDFIDYVQGNISFPFERKVVLFTNSTRAILIKQMPLDSKILFWHYETIPCAWNYVFINRETANFLKLLKANNALLFHDWSARQSIEEQYNLTYSIDLYLPLNLNNTCYLKAPNTLVHDDEINIIWLSRLSPDKVESLCNIMYNFSLYETHRKKRLHIIGDGVKRDYAESISKKYKASIECIFLGTLIGDELKQYMITNGDILFGMGTSVLEGAECHIPSVIVQLSSVPFYDDSFFWFYKTTEYCVGITHDQKDKFDVEYVTLSNILNDIYLNGNKEKYGNLSYRFYKDHFSDLSKMCTQLVGFINKDTLTFNALNRLIKYCPYVTLRQSYFCLGGFKDLPGIKIFKKTIFNRRTRYYFLGLCLFAIVDQAERRLYRIFDRYTIAFKNQRKAPYQFPMAQFNDKKGDSNV